MDQLFNNLSYLIGSEVEILGWEPDRQYPDRIRVIDEYEKHLMLELTFSRDFFGYKSAPRKVHKRINKASMFCGDVQIRESRTGKLLVGKEIKQQADIRKLGNTARPGGDGNSKYLVGY